MLGRAPDGGFWAIGLRQPDERVFTGVPMSTAQTGAVQRRRLDDLGLGVTELEVLRDVDTIADAYAVAADRANSRFARALEAMRLPASARSAPSEVTLGGE